MTSVRTWPVRTETRERNRVALIDAAAELAEEHGYAGTSLSAVAARAGLTTGAVYSIFGSKVELFLEVLLPDWNVPSGDDLTPGHDLAGFLDTYARGWARGVNRGDARKAFELQLELYLSALRDPKLLERTRTIAHDAHERLVVSLRRFAPAAVPPDELARTLVAALQGLSQQSVALGVKADEEEFVRVALRLAFAEVPQ